MASRRRSKCWRHWALSNNKKRMHLSKSQRDLMIELRSYTFANRDCVDEQTYQALRRKGLVKCVNGKYVMRTIKGENARF